MRIGPYATSAMEYPGGYLSGGERGMERRRVDVVVPRKAIGEVAARSVGTGHSLFVPVAGLRAGEAVEVSLHFEGFPHEFTVPGIVTSVRSHGRGTTLPSGATLQVDPIHHGRLEKVLAFARGETVSWVRRESPRFLIDLPVEVRAAAGTFGCRTRDLSLGGLGLGAAEALPTLGEEVEVRIPIAGSLRPLKLTGKVMWLDFFAKSRGFGVRFVGGGLGWKRRLARLVASVSGEG